MELYYWIYFIVSLITVIILWRDRAHHASTIDRLSDYLTVIEHDLEQSKEELEQSIELSEAKDKEIKKHKTRAGSANASKGQLLEKWTPFLNVKGVDPNWDAENWIFIGNPLDYVVFDWKPNTKENLSDGKVYFIEVKAAKSKLSTKQRRIRDLIKAGKVEWREIRLD
jgi:predicted Holliday junction resolvase-like endonuclease